MHADFACVNQRWIVVVGRNNFAKSSHALEQMLKDLQSMGFAVHGFESRQTHRAHRVSGWFNGLLGGSVAAYCSQAKWGVFLRKSLKAGWLLVHPADWDFSRRMGMTPNERAARDLRQLLRHWQSHWPSRRVYLFAHSAGGIVTSLVEAETNVVSLVCFGYPFRHPQLNEEPLRTVHLPSVRKPFLIFQGSLDEYGTAERAREYALSPSTRVVSINADHDYENLSSGLYQGCIELILDCYGEELRSAGSFLESERLDAS